MKKAKEKLYEHTQIGYLIWIIFLAVFLIFSFIFITITIQVGFILPILIFMILILFVLISFSSLNVTLDRNYLTIKFGYGLYKKKFLIKSIKSVKTVRNHWYYGWGIRVWFHPYRIIYNVSGLDAVEIILKTGQIYAIGTDKPKELEKAISKAIKQ